MKRILAFLTVLCLFWAMPPVARAQGNTALIYGQEAGGTSLTLEGLEETICALQLELTLQGTCPNASFVPAVSNAYVPECRVEVREDGSTVVTVYMTAPEGVLTSGSSLLRRPWCRQGGAPPDIPGCLQWRGPDPRYRQPRCGPSQCQGHSWPS